MQAGGVAKIEVDPAAAALGVQAVTQCAGSAAGERGMDDFRGEGAKLRENERKKRGEGMGCAGVREGKGERVEIPRRRAG